MADFTDIVTEFNTIATAQSGISSFKYGNVFELNESRTLSKPLLLLQKQRTLQYAAFEKKLKTYEVVVGIYDTYKEAQKSSKTYADKQKDLENLMEQFLREFRKRSLGSTTQVTSVQSWIMDEPVRMELIEVVGADKLSGIEATITIRVFSDCDEGTFSY